MAASGSRMSLGPATHQRPRSSAALLLLVCGLAGALIYFARGAFIPVALAVLFALLLSSPVEALPMGSMVVGMRRKLCCGTMCTREVGGRTAIGGRTAVSIRCGGMASRCAASASWAAAPGAGAFSCAAPAPGGCATTGWAITSDLNSGVIMLSPSL